MQDLRATSGNTHPTSSYQRGSLAVFRDADTAAKDVTNLPAAPRSAKQVAKADTRLADPLDNWNSENASKVDIRVRRILYPIVDTASLGR